MIFLGQTSAHVPQPVHRSSRTRGKRVSGSMTMASNGQARTHVPSPRQPYGHAAWPYCVAAAARQSCSPT